VIVINEKFFQRATLAVLCCVAVLIVLTFQHYGITWDEELQSQYGQKIVDYYVSGFKDLGFAQLYNLYLYGGMFDGLASTFDRLTPFGLYPTRHLLNAVFGLLGLWGTWRLARFIGQGAVGLTAVVLLVLTPMYYGHMYNNPKDIPFAAGIVWTLYYMSRCLSTLPRPPLRLLLKLGIIYGLTLGVRVGGIMAFLFWLVPLAVQAAEPLFQSRYQWRAVLINIWTTGWRLVVPVAVLSYLVMLGCWPWAQLSPIDNPLHALNEFKDFPNAVEVLLDGTTYLSTELPWFYVPLYFGVQLPGFVLLLLLTFFATLPWIWRRLKEVPQRNALILVLLMAFMPILYAVGHRPALYDAVRHFLFAVPLMCIMAALGAKMLWIFCSKLLRHSHNHVVNRLFAASAAAGLAVVFILQISLMITLHPYEYIYINQFAGGVPGAFGRYELDYWGSSFKEAAERIQLYVSKHGGVPPGKIIKIAICGPWDSAMIYLPPDYEAVEANDPADFFLSTTRWMCQGMRGGKEIIRIKRLGVPLAIVKDVKDEKP